jgi:hypothetical protein
MAPAHWTSLLSVCSIDQLVPMQTLTTVHRSQSPYGDRALREASSGTGQVQVGGRGMDCSNNDLIALALSQRQANGADRDA